MSLTLQEMKSLSEKEQKKLFDRLSGIRKQAKAVNYSCTYNVTPAGLVRNTGMSLKDAKKLHKSYWKKNWSLEAIAKDTKVKTHDGKMWLFNPVSKMWYYLKHERDIFSTLNQSSGVYCFDTWVKYILEARKQLCGTVHDEVILCIKEGYRDRCEKMLRKALQQTNDELQLSISLGCDVAFGNDYSKIH